MASAFVQARYSAVFFRRKLQKTSDRSVVHAFLAITFIIFFLLNSIRLSAQTGPGGVGNNAGTSTLSAWYRVDNGLSTTGTSVDAWTNSAGIPALSIAETGTNRPTLVGSAINGFSEVSFSGTNKLTTGSGALTTSNFVVDQASSFVVNRADNTSQQSCVYTTDPLVGEGRFSNHIPWANDVYFDIGVCCADRIQVGSLSNLNAYSIWSYDAINTATGKQLYRNGALLQSIGVAATTYTYHASQLFNIGGYTSGTAGFVGDVAEIIIFRSKINTAQRLIIQNYLSAKYNIALSANDLYTQDNSGYDFDVAGIGQVDASNTHTDSRGTGIVRILSPTGLGDGEYLFIGHNNGVLTPQTTDLPATIQARLTRVWSSQEVGDLTGVNIDFDLTGLGPVTASDLRLLVDTDVTFATGATVVSGAVAQGGNVYRFSGANLVSGTNTVTTFTLGTINRIQTPLPITLSFLKASLEKDKVKLQWRTEQEINNDVFTIERSTNGVEWNDIKTVKGNGNSNTPKSYIEYDDRPFWGISYYRLKQTDYDGSFTYSHVVSITVNKSFKDLEVYPVPAKDEVFVIYPPSENVIIKVRDEAGRDQAIVPVFGQRGTSLNTSKLSPGVYFLYITNGVTDVYRKIVIE